MKLLTIEKINSIYDISEDLSKDMGGFYKKPIEDNNDLKYHYAPLDTVFKILETDSIRCTNSRFSNDESEEKMLGQNWEGAKEYHADNYIFCVCDSGDQLSQWRGYCPNGGASIGLSIDKICDYSILFANSDIERISTKNRAIPVVYADPNACEITLKRIENKLGKYSDISIADVIPYIKNDSFIEEKESRIVFSNIENDYDNCIRFREANNRIQIPYILIKFGLTEKNYVPVSFDFSNKFITHFINTRENPMEIIIPQGKNQEKIYHAVKKEYNDLRKKNPIINPNAYILCEGHLPVKKIYVAPTYDRDRTVESLKRFCQSRYWLSEVKVEASKIPFIPPMR